METKTEKPYGIFYKDWHGKPYYSLDAYCKNTYDEKLYKIALNAGLSCPNRDGTLDDRGCIFCSAGGSGDFASTLYSDSENASLELFSNALDHGRQSLSGKQTGQRLIAYFQAYTNTYGPIDYLEKLYRLALNNPSVAGISIATRPDCLPDQVLQLLLKLKRDYADKFIWIELGLQTIHERTARWFRRGYPLSCFEKSLNLLHDAEIPVITHVILGFPGETIQDMWATIDYLNQNPVWGIKLQLLHILKNTDLAALWAQDPITYGSFATLDAYLDALISCLLRLRPDMVVHRVTGDAPRSLLLAPLWSANKRMVLNTLHQRMKQQDAFQGKFYRKDG